MNLLVGGIAVYGMVVGGLYLMQDSMIFPNRAAAPPRYPLPPGAEAITLETADNERIVGHLVRARGDSRGLLIGFSGNAWNAQDCLNFVSHRVRDWDIVIFHYRGYEPSTGSPSEAALFADAAQIYDHFVAALSPQRVVGIGFSLGSGVVSYLATERTLDGQVLFTPFDSIRAIAAKRYPIVPVKLLLKHPFASHVYQQQTDTPAAVVLASEDRVVPHAHSTELIKHLNNPVFVETVPNSTHGGIYDLPAVDDVLRRAIDAVAPVNDRQAVEVEP